MRFLKFFSRSGKGLAGVAIILAFALITVSGPLLTPYSPRGEDRNRPNFPVGSALAAPEFLRYLPSALGGNPGLSSSMWIVNHPGHPQLVEYGGEWNFTASEEVVNKAVFAELNESVNYPYSTETGSFAITFMRGNNETPYGEVKVYLKKEFYWPYSTTPGRYLGFITLLAQGTTYTEDKAHLHVPVKVNVFIEQVEEGKRYDFWPPPYKIKRGVHWEYMAALQAPRGFYVNKTKQPDGDVYIRDPERGAVDGWIIASGSPESNITQIDSQSPYLTWRSDLFGGDAFPLRAFSECPGTYRYGIELIFKDQKFPNETVQTTIFIDQFDFGIYGNAFGLLGTDHLGRDLFAQLIYGTQSSLYVGVLSAVVGVGLGLIVGLASGYLGRVVDELLMRFTDMLLVLPHLPLLIVMVAILGANLENLILLLGFLGWMGFARQVRSQVLSLRERPFVEAAKAVGAGTTHIVTRHVLPNVISLVYVALATFVPGAVVAEAALSWLGFTDPFRVSWGKMLHECQFVAMAIDHWWWVIPPGLCIAALAIAFILLGFAIDDVLNPKLRERR